ncbi:MAG: hypothetical protein H6Q10_1203 [Acidobacteria bacterium]|nr:hypothetical protein [Acidobacteriota bacterium]
MNELVALASLGVGLLGLGVLRRFLRNRQRLRLYEMAHEERMLALEKGLPAADLPAGSDFDAWLDEAWTERLLEAGWDRRVALACGLVLLFASAGAVVFAGLVSARDPDAVHVEMAAAAAIPLMASLGLLLYYRLTAAGKDR